MFDRMYVWRQQVRAGTGCCCGPALPCLDLQSPAWSPATDAYRGKAGTEENAGWGPGQQGQTGGREWKRTQGGNGRGRRVATRGSMGWDGWPFRGPGNLKGTGGRPGMAGVSSDGYPGMAGIPSDGYPGMAGVSSDGYPGMAGIPSDGHPGMAGVSRGRYKPWQEFQARGVRPWQEFQETGPLAARNSAVCLYAESLPPSLGLHLPCASPGAQSSVHACTCRQTSHAPGTHTQARQGTANLIQQNDMQSALMQQPGGNGGLAAVGLVYKNEDEDVDNFDDE